MLGLKKSAGRDQDGVPPSASSTRASSAATESPVPGAAVPSRRQGKVHAAGDVVDGRYVLIDQLGKGGMGVVWKARSTALDVEVAVKLVRSSPTPNSDAFKRMAREAHAAARLGHPAMATVLDFGATEDGDPYVVMELLHGESLGDVLGRERRVDPIRAVSTLLPILDGLREAHDKGIVHRDIKPENLFISKTTRGRLQPKVLDFGIAKLEEASESSRLTQDGAVLGSPGYFSPEQARGETDIDLRTDVWSISVVLYELITGELPFYGANYNALLMSILKDTPKSITDRGYGDAELWHILQRGLLRDRNKRWGSMGELGRALAGWLYAQGVTADVTSRSIKEGWLDVRSPSELAAPLPFGLDGPRRRVLSTIKRRVGDTLAGGTMSTLIAQHRVPTRLLGWSAAAVGVGAIVWSVFANGGSADPVAHVAAPAPPPAATLAPAAPIAAPAATASAAVAAEPPTSPVADPAQAPGARLGHPPTERKPVVAVAKPVVAARARAADAPAKTPRPMATPAKPRPTAAPARRGIDQEFGF
jgi:eukaryotic-like serine/threonine-protein kinase